MVHIPHELLLKIIQSIDNLCHQDRRSGQDEYTTAGDVDACKGRKLLATLRLTNKAINDFATPRLFEEIKLQETFERARVQMDGIAASVLNTFVRHIYISSRSFHSDQVGREFNRLDKSFGRQHALDCTYVNLSRDRKVYSEILGLFLDSCKEINSIQYDSTDIYGVTFGYGADAARNFIEAAAMSLLGRDLGQLKSVSFYFSGWWQIDPFLRSTLLLRSGERNSPREPIVNTGLARLEKLRVEFDGYSSQTETQLLLEAMVFSNDRMKDLSLRRTDRFILNPSLSGSLGFINLSILQLDEILTTYSNLVTSLPALSNLVRLSFCRIQLHEPEVYKLETRKADEDERDPSQAFPWGSFCRQIAEGSAMLIELYAEALTYTYGTDREWLNRSAIPEFSYHYPIKTPVQRDIDGLKFLVDTVTSRRISQGLPFDPWLQEFCSDPRVLVVKR